MPNFLAINTTMVGFSTYCAMNPIDNDKGLQKNKLKNIVSEFKSLQKD